MEKRRPTYWVTERRTATVFHIPRYNLSSADVRLQMGRATAEKSKSIMQVQVTVAVGCIV